MIEAKDKNTFMFFLYVQSVLIYTQDICSTIYFSYHVQPISMLMRRNSMQDLNTVTESKNIEGSLKQLTKTPQATSTFPSWRWIYSDSKNQMVKTLHTVFVVKEPSVFFSPCCACCVESGLRFRSCPRY